MKNFDDFEKQLLSNTEERIEQLTEALCNIPQTSPDAYNTAAVGITGNMCVQFTLEALRAYHEWMKA